jgi:transposase-like protein
MPRTKRASPWSVAEARAALRALSSSGLSVRSFAQREGIDEERLYRWRRYFARASKGEVSAGPVPSPALIELRPSARRAEVVEIVLAAGISVRVAETIDPAALARLVAALR